MLTEAYALIHGFVKFKSQFEAIKPNVIESPIILGHEPIVMAVHLHKIIIIIIFV